MTKISVLQCLEADSRSWKNQRYFWENFGSSYTQQISRLRAKGYKIDDRCKKAGGVKEYRLSGMPNSIACVQSSFVEEPRLNRPVFGQNKISSSGEIIPV